jgi:hypothetical protein
LAAGASDEMKSVWLESELTATDVRKPKSGSWIEEALCKSSQDDVEG